MEIYVIMLVLVAVSAGLGYWFGKKEFSKKMVHAGVIDTVDLMFKVVEYSIAQYNRVIEVGKDNTIVITAKFCPKKYREEMMDITRNAFKEFSEEEFVTNLEKRLGVTLGMRVDKENVKKFAKKKRKYMLDYAEKQVKENEKLDRKDKSE